MSALTDRITEVLRQHYLWDSFGDEPEDKARCRCDVDDPHVTNGVPDGGWMPFSEWAAHVAERVAAALQLTEETKPIIDPHWQDWCERILGYERRWVSEWTAAETQPEEKP